MGRSGPHREPHALQHHTSVAPSPRLTPGVSPKVDVPKIRYTKFHKEIQDDTVHFHGPSPKNVTAATFKTLFRDKLVQKKTSAGDLVASTTLCPVGSCWFHMAPHFLWVELRRRSILRGQQQPSSTQRTPRTLHPSNHPRNEKRPCAWAP